MSFGFCLGQKEAGLTQANLLAIALSVYSRSLTGAGIFFKLGSMGKKARANLLRWGESHFSPNQTSTRPAIAITSTFLG